MTIALALRVNDGVVLASDSASSIALNDLNGKLVTNIYDHADKVFNLRKGSPVGATVYGLGHIGEASLTTLLKDLRKRFSTPSTDWHLDPDAYTIEWVANKVSGFLFDEKYVPFLTSVGIAQDKWPTLGIYVAGYSAGKDLPEIWTVNLGSAGAKVSMVKSPLAWGGQPEAISRLIAGYDPTLPKLLAAELKLAEQDVSTALQAVQAKLEPAILPMAIPIQDALDLAQFLVDLTAKYSRYTPGYQSVGGPIDIAAITKHEGFKWVQRKHYFGATLNPPA
jgi:hypothetical protein